MTIADRYFVRLGLDPSTLDVKPTLAKLATLQEAHLARIPFENIAQHGVVKRGGLQTLDVDGTADKVLEQQRGGFCFELNLLFSIFLQELGYRVTRVPAVVLVKPDDDIATHMTLIVTCSGGESESNNDAAVGQQQQTQSSDRRYVVDVGFGEPPLHPLAYDVEHFGREQVTPEGMCSKLELDERKQYCTLYWKKKSSSHNDSNNNNDDHHPSWIARLKWNYAVSMAPTAPESHHVFSKGLHVVQHSNSVFSQKLIVCKLTRDRKYTLSGYKYKITGPPRFGSDDDNVPVVEEHMFETIEQVRHCMEDVFGIPYQSTEGLDLAKSKAAHPGIWSAM